MATESRTLVLLALVANAGIAVLKFIAAAISGSSAMLAEGFHSVADSGNQLFLLRGTAASRYAATVRHPFGRGKELYFWSFMVAVFLFVGGAVVAVIEGWERIRHPEEPESIGINLAVLGVAAVFEIAVAFVPAVKEFNRRRGGRKVWPFVRESKDPALLVVLFEDTAAVIGLIFAAVGIIIAEVTGNGRWDGVASIVIGILLASVAWILAYETKAMLVGEGATRRERSAMRAAALAVPQVQSVGNLLTMQLGPDEVLVTMEVDFDPGLSGEQVAAAIDEIKRSVAAAVPTATRISVEANGPPPREAGSS